jgi:hypothetical protein
MKPTIATLALLFAAASACGGSSDAAKDCSTGKCDTPGGDTIEAQCENARVPAMDERRPHFVPTGVRWSCRDVNGVTSNSDTSDDRGQEYCEYFTMLHTDGIPAVLVNDQGPVFCDASTPCAEGTCDESIFSCVSATSADLSQPADVLGKNIDSGQEVTPLDPKLSPGQLDWLAQNPEQKVGECVFTSWHNDITTAPSSSETVGGYALDAPSANPEVPLFRMAVQFNSNGAAQQLIEDCLHTGDASIEDGFTRGCTSCGNAACVPWRKSDPSICTMTMRIAECGCQVEVKQPAGASRTLDFSGTTALPPDDLALAKELFIPTSRRGFTLGTWDGIGQLPTGCRFVKMGDPTRITINGVEIDDPNADQTLVACDLKGSHITAATAKDPKEACRQTYGEDVVVHVRAPDTDLVTLTCDTAREGCEGAPWDFASL